MTVATVVGWEPLLDHSYQQTALGPDVVAWLDYLKAGDRSDNTRDGYERTLARAALTFPDLPLEQWTHRDILRVLVTWPPGSRPMRRKAFNGFFGWATDIEERLLRNPMRKLPKPRPQNVKHVDIFTDAEIDDLLSLPLIDATLMHVLFGTGIRKGEAMKLQVRRLRLDPPEPHIVILGGKGDKDRKVDIAPRLVEALQGFLLLERLDPQDHLWYSRPGGTRLPRRHRPISDSSFDHWWGRCLEQAGVRYRKPHTTRHTYATRWLQRRGRMETLKLQLGHKSIQTTLDMYGHLERRDVIADLLLVEARD